MKDISETSKVLEILKNKWECFTPHTRQIVQELMLEAYIAGSDRIDHLFDSIEIEKEFEKWFDKHYSAYLESEKENV